MAKITKETMEKLFPDWHVSECNYDNYEKGFEFSMHSPAGEEFLIDVCGETFCDMARNVEDYYNGFDADDHAAQIYHAKHYGSEDEQRFYASAPDSLQDLIEDARWIDSRIWDVREVLWNEWQKQEDGDDD